MAVKLKPISQQTIVITGASSGIGLCTARAAAAEGANLVLASRNGQVLAEVCEQIRQDGGSAEYIVADVGRREDLQQLAELAIERFGGFDTWVNNAGVGIWGRIEEVSEADNRRLFETNFWGVVDGSLIAAKHLKQDGGAIINIGSVESDMVLPLQGLYSASKHAVKAFTEVLRVELEEEGAPVSVSLIKPAGIATPMPQHMKNYLETEMTWAPPVYRPEDVAAAILHAACHPVRDLRVGSGSKAFALLEQIAPRALDMLNEKYMFDAQKLDEHKWHTMDNLHGAGPDGDERGYFPTRTVRPSVYTKATMHPVITASLVAAAGLAVAGLISGRVNGQS